MDIEIFGPGCYRCKQLEANIQQAVSELGLSSINIKKISDYKQIVDADIIETPGLRINNIIKSTGYIPSIEEIKKWLQEDMSV